MAFGGLATGAKQPYDLTIPEIARAKAWLKKWKPNILKLVNQNTETVTALKDESAWIGLGNLGVELRVKAAGGPLVKVAYPKEGLLGWFDGEQKVSKSKHKDVFETFMNSVEGQTSWIAKNFIANGRPMFNEKAYKLLVNQGYKHRADAFNYSKPELIFKAHLQGPVEEPAGDHGCVQRGVRRLAPPTPRRSRLLTATGAAVEPSPPSPDGTAASCPPRSCSGCSSSSRSG